MRGLSLLAELGKGKGKGKAETADEEDPGGRDGDLTPPLLWEYNGTAWEYAGGLTPPLSGDTPPLQWRPTTPTHSPRTPRTPRTPEEPTHNKGTGKGNGKPFDAGPAAGE